MTKRTIKKAMVQAKKRIEDGDLPRAIEILDEAIKKLIEEGLTDG